MNPSGIDKLTKRQKECLRLVEAGYEGKEIAAKLGISLNTMNRRLESARLRLGVNRSIQAARLLIEHEGGNRIAPKPIVIAPIDEADNAKRAVAPDPFDAPARNRSHLEGLPTLVLIVATAFLAVSVLGSVRAVLEDLTRLFWDYRIDISDEPYR